MGLYITKRGMEELSDRCDDSTLDSLEGWILWEAYEHPGKYTEKTDFIGRGEMARDLAEVVVEDLVNQGYLKNVGGK